MHFLVRFKNVMDFFLVLGGRCAEFADGGFSEIRRERSHSVFTFTV
jgi:hypothetical protein